MMTVGIVGLGLIGGSMARAVKRAGYRVYGADINRAVLLKAQLLEIVDQELNDENMADCGVIILGIYPEATLEWLEAHGPHISRETVVMDTCGVKRAVCGPAGEIAARYGSFCNWFWGFTDGWSIQNAWREMDEVPATSPLSDRIAREMKQLGFRFLGSTILYAHMQATGMVNDHIVGCFRREEVARMGAEGPIR